MTTFPCIASVIFVLYLERVSFSVIASVQECNNYQFSLLSVQIGDFFTIKTFKISYVENVEALNYKNIIC